MLFDNQRTLSAVLEILHDQIQDMFSQELKVFQTCFAMFDNVNKVFALINDEQRWKNLDFNVKVDLIVDLIEFPF